MGELTSTNVSLRHKKFPGLLGNSCIGKTISLTFMLIRNNESIIRPYALLRSVLLDTNRPEGHCFI
jgi:hypothetical protein